MIRRQLREHTPAAPVYYLPTELAPVSVFPSDIRLTVCDEFATAQPSRKGPVSNTGLNPPTQDGSGFSLSIDYCTLVFSQDKAAELGQTTRTICGWLFGSGFSVSELRAKTWQFYRSSAYIRDENGDTVGRIGCDGNGDTWCVSLTGAGCKRVADWGYTYHQALYLDAHISRVDFAFDDFGASVFGNIHRVDGMARKGEFAGKGRGRPPRTHFIDDHGSNNGCTVYVGCKGRKELCVYEKGKQLGDPDSPWIRAEVRLWRNNAEIPLDALIRPAAWFAGAYDALAELTKASGEGSRPEAIKREVAATAVAAVRFLHEQCGPLLSTLWEALGPDAEWFFRREVFRAGMPNRFKGRAVSPEALAALLRSELSPALDPPF